ncbi:MAG TPA: hypothetical protein VGI58_13940 [Streptosporangiaceae bacterium]
MTDPSRDSAGQDPAPPARRAAGPGTYLPSDEALRELSRLGPEMTRLPQVLRDYLTEHTGHQTDSVSPGLPKPPKH